MYRDIFCGLFLPLATVAVGQVSNDGDIKVQSCGDTAIVVSGRVAERWMPVLTIESGSIVGESTDTSHEVAYDMITGKRTHCANRYVEREYALAGGDTITMRVYDDGVAWSGCHDYKVDISQASHSWLMEWIESYEGFFRKDRADIADGFRVAYPSLFEYGDKNLFMLLTESGIDKSSAASSLYASCAKGRFEIHPDGEEMPGWQTAIIGSLADVVESTLVNDNSVPSRISDTSWIKPGVASWIYWAYNHGSNDYDIICRYVDMAHELMLPYVLIDAEWDEMKNGKTVLDAVNYARDKGVMPMIWYYYWCDKIALV
ncbi:glycoside hydrolase family 97 N-terminal domain-containing protein [Muribaculum intestinale]|uniref:glycoside hydrolase family 97 N-terminal domain-containing protein n=1 Tax=Muribaculum intestinale TaxID=1796646 RepID=UPI0026EAFDFD|nr:glycoside hydrolase family 97 N-terminal domain-containing protein [Muribaculum intestinale]